MEQAEDDSTKRSITSEELSTSAIAACWLVAISLLAGDDGNVPRRTGAAPAAMILFGSLFVVLGLMKRVPLSLEVGGAKFDAGRKFGIQQGSR